MYFQYGFTSCVIVRVVYNFNLIRKTIKACVLCVFLCVCMDAKILRAMLVRKYALT